MQGTLLAASISPSNTPHAYNLTFLFPEIMFVVVAAALYLRFRNRHLALLAGRRPYRPSAGSAAGSATAVAEASPAKSDTTSGSTLHDGEASESSAQATTVQETTVQEMTVQPTTTAEPATEDGE